MHLSMERVKIGIGNEKVSNTNFTIKILYVFLFN